MTGDCESERIWKLIESSRSLQTAVKKKSPLTLWEQISNVCVDASEKLQDKRFTAPVDVLEQLLGSIVTPSVIIDLLPGHEGYTISLSKQAAGSHAHQRGHQITLPYEDTELLDYLDAGHIPPVLLELINQTHCCQLVDGCLVVELRNHRGYHNSSRKYSKHHFLLKPTAQNVIAAVNHAVNIHKITDDDGFQLERKILLATQPPLCLDTSTDVTCVANRLQYNKHKFHTHCIKRYLKRRTQAVQTRAQMMQNGPPPKCLRLHQVIPRDSQVASHDLRLHDPATTTSVSLTLPSTPDRLLQEVNNCLPKETTSTASVETPKQSPVVTTTTNQTPLLMKNYNEEADKYLVKPTKAPVVPLPMPVPVSTVAGIKPNHPLILSPIEKPLVFVSTVHPSSGLKITEQQQQLPLRPPTRGTMVRPALPTARPIPSVTPVRPNPVTPPTGVRPHVKISAPAKHVATSPITAVPLVSSPAVNIIPPAVMAQIASNKTSPLSVALNNPVSVCRPVSVAMSNPPVSVSVGRPVSVAMNNPPVSVSFGRPVSVAMNNPPVSVSFGRPVSVAMNNPPVSVGRPVSVAMSNPAMSIGRFSSVTTINPSPSVPISNPTVTSGVAGRNVAINIAAPPAGITRIRPPFHDRRMQLPPILRKRPVQPVPPRPAQPIQKPATPPPPMLRASSPNPPPRPPQLKMGPRPKLMVNPQHMLAQKPPNLPPPPVLPRMPMLQRGALRSNIPTTSTK